MLLASPELLKALFRKYDLVHDRDDCWLMMRAAMRDGVTAKNFHVNGVMNGLTRITIWQPSAQPMHLLSFG